MSLRRGLLAAFGSAILAGTSSPDLRAATGEDQALTVHIVHLTGHWGDKDLDRAQLITEHEGCVEVHTRLGAPTVAMLPRDAFPATPNPAEHEIYYSANRTLTVHRGIKHYIADDCSLGEQHFHHRRLDSSIGTCDMDMVRGTATGQCDAAKHAVARPRVATPERPPFPDFERVPPHLRESVRAQIENMPQRLAAMGLKVEADAGGPRQIAGYDCTLYRMPALPLEKCIATPEGSPFPIPVAPLHHDHHGLLLELRSPQGHSRADSVQFSVRVPQSVFAIPPGTLKRN